MLNGVNLEQAGHIRENFKCILTNYETLKFFGRKKQDGEDKSNHNFINV